MTSDNLLVELFVEELPPKALKRLGESFASVIADHLRLHGLASIDSVATAYASPRRLGLHLTRVSDKAADKSVQVKLMPTAVALDAQGQPTPALLKRLAALGQDASAAPRLKRIGEGKAETLYLDSHQAGATLAEGLQNALDESLAKLPIPKVMGYQLADGWTSVHFVRPAHGLVALHGERIVPIATLGLTAGRETRGHRFEASQPVLSLPHADAYDSLLREQGAVIAGFAERRADIVRQLDAAALPLNARPVDDDALLDEVTALVERPNVLLCQFEPEFLGVPQECLILTMKANQKYFPLLDAGGKLTHRFLVVSNIRPADPSRVIEGNERVVRPRLADAKFFFDQDRKKSLADRVAGLDKVVYHAKLGTMGERMQRVRHIARSLGARWDGESLAEQADRAAELAKADLLTDMVGEFPELQGIMGGYYARHDGLGTVIADAIEDHYKPRFAGDALPRNEVGVVVALADKLETLAGLFGIGQLPTGDKDPFALRRHALGVIRMLIERDLALPLADAVQAAIGAFVPASHGRDGRAAPAAAGTAQPASSSSGWAAAFDGRGADVAEGITNFVCERLAGSLRDAGFSAQEVDAVMSLRPARLSEIPKRLAAVRAFAALPEAVPLAAANKRVGNILKKTDASNGMAAEVSATLLKEPAEAALHEALMTVTPKADAAFAAGDYTASLKALAALKSPVDAFFDGVMVNADDPALRANRLALLARLHAAMNRVADLSKLAT